MYADEVRSTLIHMMRRRVHRITEALREYGWSLNDENRLEISKMLVRCSHLLLEAQNVALDNVEVLRMCEETGRVIRSMDDLLNEYID